MVRVQREYLGDLLALGMRQGRERGQHMAVDQHAGRSGTGVRELGHLQAGGGAVRVCQAVGPPSRGGPPPLPVGEARPRVPPLEPVVAFGLLLADGNGVNGAVVQRECRRVGRAQLRPPLAQPLRLRQGK